MKAVTVVRHLFFSLPAAAAIVYLFYATWPAILYLAGIVWFFMGVASLSILIFEGE